MVTIKNKATDEVYEITEDQWEEMKAKPQPGDERFTMDQLYTVVKPGEKKAIDKQNIPAEFKKVAGRNESRTGGQTPGDNEQ